MLFHVLLFELKYRIRSWENWLYLGLSALLGFGFAAAGATELFIWKNMAVHAPVAIARYLLMWPLFGLLFASAIMGTPVRRDFDGRAAAMIFTSGVTPFHYLAGRFLGSFLVLVIAAGTGVLGSFLAWFTPWSAPFFSETTHLQLAAAHFHPFLFLMLPGVFFLATLFFAGGTLFRSSAVVYLQVLAVAAIWLAYAGAVSAGGTLAWLDPFAITAVTEMLPELSQETLLNGRLPLWGPLIINRLCWTALGLAVLAWCGARFRFHEKPESGREKIREVASSKAPQSLWLPQVTRVHNLIISPLLSTARLHYHMLLKETPFPFMVLILLIAFGGNMAGEWQNAGAAPPMTWILLGALNNIKPLLFLFAAICAGELVHKERATGYQPLLDAAPFSNFLMIPGKFLAALLIQINILVFLFLMAIILQTLNGYVDYQLDLYFAVMMGQVFPGLFFMTLTAFAVHVLSGHKGLGHVMFLFLLVVQILLSAVSRVFTFGMVESLPYTPMTGFGLYSRTHAWFMLYWIACTPLVFLITNAFDTRGVAEGFGSRVRLALHRLGTGSGKTIPAIILVVVMLGAYLWRQTAVLNPSHTEEEQIQLQADYEKKWGHHAGKAQPRIDEIHLELDLRPETSSFTAEGRYLLKNKETEPVSVIYVQEDFLVGGLKTRNIQFSKPAHLVQHDPVFKVSQFQLESPLQPGESLSMTFETLLQPRGFPSRGSHREVVSGGSYITADLFPGIGFDLGLTLSQPHVRSQLGLESIAELDPDHPEAGRRDPRHFINRFQAVVQTPLNQRAVTQGRLRETWVDGDRKFYKYVMNQPMVNTFAFLVGDYRVLRETYKGPDGKLIDLEVYFTHESQDGAAKILETVKETLAWCVNQYGSYQYDHLTMVQRPAWYGEGSSFPGMFALHELAFHVEDRPGKLNLSRVAAAHETAHQWWGFQVSERRSVKGAKTLSESLCEYTALMVCFPQNRKPYLDYRLNKYLRGRAGGERFREMPLGSSLLSQSYAYYGKGALAFNALGETVGFDTLNQALKAYASDWSVKEGHEPRPTMDHLMIYLQDAIPAGNHHLLEDWFQNLTVYQIKVEEAAVHEEENGYRMKGTISLAKTRDNGFGQLTEIPPEGLVDVHIYGESNGGECLIDRRRVRVTEKFLNLDWRLPEKPNRIVVDPHHKLLDLNPEDNVWGL